MVEPDAAALMIGLIDESYSMIPSDRARPDCSCGLCRFVRARERAFLQIQQLTAQGSVGAAASAPDELQPSWIRFDYLDMEGCWASKMITHDEMRRRYADLWDRLLRRPTGQPFERQYSSYPAAIWGAADRIQMVKTFGEQQCQQALLAPNLQPSVKKAIKRRLAVLAKAAELSKSDGGEE